MNRDGILASLQKMKIANETRREELISQINILLKRIGTNSTRLSGNSQRQINKS